MPLKTMWLILTTPCQTDELSLVHLVTAEQFGVVAESRAGTSSASTGLSDVQ